MRFVKASKPITTNHPELGKLEVDVEVPQVDTEEEAFQLCGGLKEFIIYFNNCIETSSKNGGRAALRQAPADANVQELYGKVREAVKEYSPSVSTDLSVKAQAEARNKALEALKSGAELTREELLEMLEGSK